jgi:ParB-like chromosome segregation protein Spo0J
MTLLKRKLTEIHLNPENPRLIKDDNFRRLCESIKNFPKMLEIKPIVIDDLGEILAGNQRYRACKELGIKEVPVLLASNLTEDQKQEFIVKDNSHYGEWDFNMLSTFHDAETLEEWGVPVFPVGEITPIDLTSKEPITEEIKAKCPECGK